MLRKICLASLIVLALPLASTQAGVRIGVGIGVPFGGYYYGPGPYYGGYPYYGYGGYYPYYRPYGAVYVAPAPSTRSPLRSTRNRLRSTRSLVLPQRTLSRRLRPITRRPPARRTHRLRRLRTIRSRRLSRRHRCSKPSRHPSRLPDAQFESAQRTPRPLFGLGEVVFMATLSPNPCQFAFPSRENRL